MSKNAIIGLLVVAVVVGGGYLLMKKSPGTSNNTDTTKQTSDSKASEKPAPNPTLTVGAPIVETNSSFSASSSTVSVTGQVIPNGVPTTYWFEYNEAGGLINRTTQQSIGSGFSPRSSPAFITGLRANTSYSFRLMANNNFGTVYGSTYTFKTNSDPAPKASTPSVSTKSASSVSRTSANLNGQVNPNGWQTNYWFEYGKDSNFGNTTSIISVDENVSLTSMRTVSESLTGLEPLTKYYFRLNAQNQFGTVNGSTLNFTTSGPQNPALPTVTTNSASNITDDSVKLSGRINPNGANSTYWFEYSTDSLLGSIIGSGTTKQSLNAGTNTVSVEANVGDLNKNTKYFYRLVGQNQYGTARGSIMFFTTKS